MDREAPKGLMITIIIVGILLFLSTSYLQLKNEIEHNYYENAKATYLYKVPAGVSDSGTQMYKLIYEYEVDGKGYRYTTDYSTSVIPRQGSTIKVKYNPNLPNEAYSKTFNVYNIFQILGVMFICIPLIILFSNILWLRDIILITFCLIFILMFIFGGLFSGWGIIAVIILGIMCFLGIFDFIHYLKNNTFNPIGDIKREIEITKELRKQKKEAKLSVTAEEKTKRKIKIKKIIIGLLLFLIPIPLITIIYLNIGFPNDIIYYIFSIISILCVFVGFCIFGTAAFMSDNKEYRIRVAGKVIDNDIIENRKKLSLIEKIKAFRIIEVILSIISVPSFLGIIFFIIEDPLKIYQNFEIVGRAQLFTILIIILIINILYLIINKICLFKRDIIRMVVVYVICFIVFYLITIPSDANKVTLSSSDFKEKMVSKEFAVFKEKKIKFLNNYNSDIYLAQKNNIKIYYVIGEDRKTIRKIEESLNDNKYKDCIENNLSSVSGAKKVLNCKKPSYVRIFYKIKNTLMIAESDNISDEERLNNLLSNMGYNNIN